LFLYFPCRFTAGFCVDFQPRNNTNYLIVGFTNCLKKSCSASSVLNTSSRGYPSRQTEQLHRGQFFFNQSKHGEFIKSFIYGRYPRSKVKKSTAAITLRVGPSEPAKNAKANDALSIAMSVLTAGFDSKSQKLAVLSV